jgi:hypothetical protein
MPKPDEDGIDGLEEEPIEPPLIPPPLDLLVLPPESAPPPPRLTAVPPVALPPPLLRDPADPPDSEPPAGRELPPPPFSWPAAGTVLSAKATAKAPMPNLYRFMIKASRSPASSIDL